MKDQSAVSIPTLSSGLFGALPKAVRVYTRYLEEIIRHQQAYIQQRQDLIQKVPNRFHALESRLSKNSSNSSKFPSSGGLKRPPHSLRTKSRKNPGDQQDQTGEELAQISNPALIVLHAHTTCRDCGCSLTGIGGSCGEFRQVFDIPRPKNTVTKHRVEGKRCPCCDGKNPLDQRVEKRSCALRFMRNFSDPFTNTHDEQDIRMVKLKQKISGCFRTSTGVQFFCHIRSYISTARKPHWNIWGDLTDAIGSSPPMLAHDQPATIHEACA